MIYFVIYKIYNYKLEIMMTRKAGFFEVLHHVLNSFITGDLPPYLIKL